MTVLALLEPPAVPDTARSRALDVAATVAEATALAEAVEVTDRQQAEQAALVLTRIAQTAKDLEAARDALVRPHNTYVKATNDEFKAPAAALAAAREIVGEKVLAYNREAERLRRAEEARLHAEREAAERLAREERERAEAVAREAEARRQAKLSDAASVLEREMGGLSPDELVEIAFGDPHGARVEAAQRELARRRSVRQAEAAAETARAAEEATRAAPMQAVAPVERHAGISTPKRWTATVIDESLVPREFLVVDLKAINAAMRDGAREIPGVRIEQVETLAVRT